jgi:hypothetical protein
MPTLHVYWSDRHERSEQHQLQAAVAAALGGPQEIVIWYHWFRAQDVYVDGVRLDKLGLEESEDLPPPSIAE